MSADPEPAVALLGFGVVDERGLSGTYLPRVAWPADAADPLRTSGLFRRSFGRSDPTFRRLDRMSRALVLATEAAGIGRWPADARRDTAIVAETSRGSLESDLAFARGLASGSAPGPQFAYTLPSTCLGEIALRHGLRGPTLCLSIGDEGAGAAVSQARALLESGEATHAVAARIEILASAWSDVAPALRVVVVGLGPRAAGDAPLRWPARDEDPFGAFELRQRSAASGPGRASQVDDLNSR